MKDIKTFEELNDLSINVYGLEKVSYEIEVVGPLHYTKRKRRVHVNLVLFSEEEQEVKLPIYWKFSSPSFTSGN